MKGQRQSLSLNNLNEHPPASAKNGTFVNALWGVDDLRTRNAHNHMYWNKRQQLRVT